MSAGAVLNNSGLLAIDIEDTVGPGTPETMDVADVLIPVGDIEYGLDIETHPNDLNYTGFDSEGDFVGVSPASIKFFHLLRASGTAGTAPAMGGLLQLMNMTETVVASTSVTYEPVTPGTGSFTAALWRRRSGSTTAGSRWTLKGGICAETRIVFEVGKDVRVSHTLMGAHHEVADSAYVTPTFSETGAYWQALGTSMTIGAWSPVFDRMELVISYEAKRIDDPGSAHASGLLCYEVTDRKTTGSIRFLHQSAATKDFIADVQAGTEAALSMDNGGSAGSIITLNIPKLQMLNPSFSDDGGLDYVTMPFKANKNGSAADEEFSIVLT